MVVKKDHSLFYQFHLRGVAFGVEENSDDSGVNVADCFSFADSRNYGIAITFARPRFKIFKKIANHIQIFFDC